MSECDFNKTLDALRNGQGLTGKDGILTPLVKQLTEAALKAELDTHLATDDTVNRKNGTTKKTIKSSSGSFELETPRDRAQGHFIIYRRNELSRYRHTHH